MLRRCHFCSQARAEVFPQAMAILKANGDFTWPRPLSSDQQSQGQILLCQLGDSTFPTILGIALVHPDPTR